MHFKHRASLNVVNLLSFIYIMWMNHTPYHTYRPQKTRVSRRVRVLNTLSDTRTPILSASYTNKYTDTRIFI